MTNQDILTRISALRNAKKLSARELSLRIGMSAQYVGQLEHGKITLSVPVLLSILEELDVTVDEFFYTPMEHYSTDKALFDVIKGLPHEKKVALLHFILS